LNEPTVNIPGSAELEQNYPNPFNPSTSIRYKLQSECHVSLAVFDISGKQIFSLVNERQSAGIHSLAFSAGNTPSGVYIYSLYINGIRGGTKKMILLK
jgi:hypothetical protein